MDISRTKENLIIFITKCILVILGLFAALPYVKYYIWDIYKLCLVWCFICVIYLFVKRRYVYWKREYLILFLFCVSYGITILLYDTQHLFNEIGVLGYTGLLFFALTYCDCSRTEKEVKKEISILSRIIVVITFLFSLIGITMFIFSISGEIVYTDTVIVYGMRENRLWGLYNPNTGSVLSSISILISLLLLKERKDSKVFLGVNIILQVFYFILTQSRGGWVCLISYILIYFVVIKKYFLKKDYKIWRKVIYKIGIAVSVCVIVVIGSHFIKLGLSYIPEGVNLVLENENVDKISQEQKTETKKNHLERLDKKESNIESISTGRSDLWKIGLKAYKCSPILGVGYNNIDVVLQEELSMDSYQNSAGGGLHNVYITVLVSAGLVGFLLFGIYLLLLLKRVLVGLLNKTNSEYEKCILAFIPMWLVGELVESRIAFGMNFLSILFWIFVGYVSYYTTER